MKPVVVADAPIGGPAPRQPTRGQRWKASDRMTSVSDRHRHQQQPATPGTLPPPTPATGPGCRHFERCSGCSLEDGLDHPPLYIEAVAFFQGLGQPLPPLHAGRLHGWRHRARLAARPRSARDPQPVIGLFEEGTHSVLAIPECQAHHPAINAAVAAVQECAAALGISGYDERSGSGQLRYLQATVVDAQASSSSSSRPKVQLVLVWNSTAAQEEAAAKAAAAKAAARPQQQSWRRPPRRPPATPLRRLAAELWSRHGGTGSGLLHSIHVSFQPGQTNTILGHEWALLQGEERAWASLGGADVCFGPASFMQANPEAMDAALGAIAAWVPPGAAIADLHAGVGTIGLSLAAKRSPRLVRAVEVNAAAEAPFRASAQRMQQRWQRQRQQQGPAHRRQEQQQGGSPPPQLGFFAAAAGSAPERWLQGCDVVVCDPPRKGLEPELLDCLAAPARLPSSVRRLVYLSCGFPALERDAEALLASGCWRLAHAQAFLFFPGTNHIETLAVFDRTT